MPLTTDMTTISVVVAMTTPSKVRKERSLWLRSASSAIQKASRAVTQRVAPRGRRAGRADGSWSALCGVTVPPRCHCASCLPCLPLHEVIIPWNEYATAGVSVPRGQRPGEVWTPPRPPGNDDLPPGPAVIYTKYRSEEHTSEL